MTRYNLTREELSLALYLYSVSGRTLTHGEIQMIAEQRMTWFELAWRLGVPRLSSMTIFLSSGVRGIPGSCLPWVDVNMTASAGGGEYKEKISLKRHKYEYRYEDKRRGIEEKLEITGDTYEYEYKTRFIQEKLKVK
ncbi:MAG: hypothetical protein ACM3WV_04275 [Bacillota bacterium]